MLSEAETEADNKGSTNKNFYAMHDGFFGKTLLFLGKLAKKICEYHIFFGFSQKKHHILLPFWKSILTFAPIIVIIIPFY